MDAWARLISRSLSLPASLTSALAFSMLPSSLSSKPASVSNGVPQMNIALQILKYFSEPTAPNRKSSWLKAYISAWRILGLSNGLCNTFGRKVY